VRVVNVIEYSRTVSTDSNAGYFEYACIAKVYCCDGLLVNMTDCLFFFEVHYVPDSQVVVPWFGVVITPGTPCNCNSLWALDWDARTD